MYVCIYVCMHVYIYAHHKDTIPRTQQIQTTKKQNTKQGGSVANILQAFGAMSEDIVRSFTRQILLGLSYLHRNNVIHRDLKPGVHMYTCIVHAGCTYIW